MLTPEDLVEVLVQLEPIWQGAEEDEEDGEQTKDAEADEREELDDAE